MNDDTRTSDRPALEDIETYINNDGEVVIKQHAAWWSSCDVAILVVHPANVERLVVAIRAAARKAG